MEYEIIIRPEAEKGLTDAFVWYEDKRKGLAGILEFWGHTELNNN